jgi:hypothetical protein
VDFFLDSGLKGDEKFFRASQGGMEQQIDEGGKYAGK